MRFYSIEYGSDPCEVEYINSDLCICNLSTSIDEIVSKRIEWAQTKLIPSTHFRIILYSFIDGEIEELERDVWTDFKKKPRILNPMPSNESNNVSQNLPITENSASQNVVISNYATSDTSVFTYTSSIAGGGVIF